MTPLEPKLLSPDEFSRICQWVKDGLATHISALEQQGKDSYQHAEAGVWLAAGNRIVVHGWKKSGPRGARKVWNCRELEIT